jgi:hypothetical protein
MYLPAFLIAHDPGQLGFYARIDSLYQPSGEGVKQYAIRSHAETGRRSIKYPMGVALFQLPLFLVAHAYALATDYSPDGYSAPYQLAVAFSTILWVALGLFLLRRFLLSYYSDQIAWIALGVIAFGTNLYHYTAFYPGWSHPYSFFLFCWILYLTGKWYNTGKSYFLLSLGLALGLSVITRPTNILFGVFPVLYGITSVANIKHRLVYFLQNGKSVIAAAIIFGLVVMLQLSYWKYVTGHWIFDAYENQVFDFAHPAIYKGLFSYRKGWLVYTPIALFMLLGFFTLFNSKKPLFIAPLVYIIGQIYIVFSWKLWHYEGCFTCRPMVDALPVLAIPTCALIEWISKAGNALRLSGIVLAIALTGLNLFQTYQHALGVIHFDRTTRAYYWRVFGKLEATDEDRKLLRPASEDEPR